MKQNTHIAALVRIIALQITNGNRNEAEALLKWAYKENESADETIGFIQDYLNPESKANKKVLKRFTATFIGNDHPEINFGTISSHIRKMTYSDFLKTPYWKATALAVKERDGHRCRICGTEKKLVAHHNTYVNHGDEIHHLEDLVCICKDCHKSIHNK